MASALDSLDCPVQGGLLQRGLVQHSSVLCLASASRTERRWAPRYWHSTQRAHYSCTSWHVALAAHHSTRWLQDCADGLQLHPWFEPSLLPRHLSSSRIYRGRCDAEVSQLRRTRWAPNEKKMLRSTQLPCCHAICLEQCTATSPKRCH